MQSVNAQFIRIERTYGPEGLEPFLNDIEDSSHILTAQFVQKIEKRGAVSGN